MNTFQISTMSYLSNPNGSRHDRTLALKDLIDLDFFNPDYTEERCREMLVDYINENDRGFCDGGLRRIREGLGLWDSQTYTVTIRVSVTGEDLSEYQAVHNGQFGTSVRDALIGIAVAQDEEVRIKTVDVQRVTQN